MRREAIGCEARKGSIPWVARCLDGASSVVAATDYVRAVPEMTRQWVPGSYATLGTDGFGRSDTRAALRAYFGVDRDAIVRTALARAD